MSLKKYNILNSLQRGRPPGWTHSPMGKQRLREDYELFFYYWVPITENPSAEMIVQSVYTIKRVEDGEDRSIWYHVPKSVYKDGDPRDFVEVRAGKRNENHLKALIQQKLDDYLFDNNDRSYELFKEQQDRELTVFRNFLCPDYKMNEPHLKIFRDLELYEKCLNQIIGESTKDDNRRKEAVPNYVRFHVLTKVLDYSKLSDLSKDEKIKILHWITDASGVSAYKAIFTSQKSGVKQHVEEQSKIDPNEIFELINKILDN